MKYAVIQTGGKQYLVEPGQELDVELVGDSLASEKKLSFEPLLAFDSPVGEQAKVMVGQPKVSGVKVSAEVVEPEVKGDKVTVLRYKAKKRVNVKTGHRQKYTRIKITAIGK